MYQLLKPLVLAGHGNMMTVRAPSPDAGHRLVSPAVARGTASALTGATAVAEPSAMPNQLADDLDVMAMSIDTPSYAQGLGMGQPGCAEGFAGGGMRSFQDLAQSMSIDGVQSMQFWDNAATLTPGGFHAVF